MTLGGATLAAPPEAKPDTKQATDQLRAYLPTLRQKAILGNERDHVAALEKLRTLYTVYLEGGIADQRDFNWVEEELLRARGRVLRGRSAYLDSLDQFTQRFRVGPERLGRMEEALVTPLTSQFQQFEGLSQDYWAAREAVLKNLRSDKALKVRRTLVESLSTSPLTKDTLFRKNFRKSWGEWEKAKELRKNMREATAERVLLLERQNELRRKRKPTPPADRQRLDDLELSIALGKLEEALRLYEAQPGKGLAEKGTPRQERLRRRVDGASKEVLEVAFRERLDRYRRSWPELRPVRVKGVDLLACEREKAEQTVASMLKGPEAALAGKRVVRQVRTLAELYGLQKRLFDLVYMDWDRRMGDLYFPPPPPDNTAAASDQQGPPHLGSGLLAAGPLLRTTSALARTKREMLETWIDYQTARLDLYRALELPPP